MKKQTELLTLKEACEILKCHPNTLRKWDREGKLQSIRFGSRGDRRFQKSDILGLLGSAPAVKHSDKISGVHGFEKKDSVTLPFFASTVAAGFPSPADDFIEDKLDLNELVVRHPSATFFVRASGNSMINAGINSGDILIVDRALDPSNDSIIIAVLNGELTVKRIKKTGKELYLVPDNPYYSPIHITDEMQFEIWGTVTHVLHKTR